jgi:isocitrate dehydrogenase
MNQKRQSITVAYGDGIGPEIMQACIKILDATGANLEYETIEIGQKVYSRNVSSGIEPSSWESLRKTKIFLKAPITTPQGGGFKSLNVTVRKTLGLYANIRPCVSYHPAVPSNHPSMDIVIVRENEEDLYAGIEHRQSQDVVQCLKLISRPGCEKIIRYAFEYAVRHGRKKVSCFSKDNIMKLTDGLFHRVFDEIAAEYPTIQNDHYIIDIGAARIASHPEKFDVIVTLNLYGDIISDVAAEVTGSVGLAGSANIGDNIAMFEAIHGSAPDIAGKGIANPTGLLQGAVMMLVHMGKNNIATTLQNAILKTLEDGVHTADIYNPSVSTKKVSTMEYAQAVIDRLGMKPSKLKPAQYPETTIEKPNVVKARIDQKKELIGVDVFVDSSNHPDQLATNLVEASRGLDLKLEMISNRGVKVWPDGFPETFLTDLYRCRFQVPPGQVLAKTDLINLLSSLNKSGIDFVKTEHLYNFDGKPGFSLGQGQ